MKLDDNKLHWFDEGARAHERGRLREDAGTVLVPRLYRDAWFAGYDAHVFYTLQRRILCRAEE